MQTVALSFNIFNENNTDIEGTFVNGFPSVNVHLTCANY